MPENTESTPIKNLLTSIDAKYRLADVHFYTIGFREFHKLATNNTSITAEFGTVYAACIGGAFRSPALASFLKSRRFQFAEEKPKGHGLLDLAKDIQNGKLSDKGKVIPKGCVLELDTLFVCLDLKYNEDVVDDGLLTLIAPLMKIQNNLGQVKLDIVIIDSEEAAMLRILRQTEDPDYTPSPPPFPEIS